MIPDSFIQELLQRIDIVNLIDGYVPLKKAGANYAACCPFHSEKTPSFTVSPNKQFYHCFGCGAHGTAIGFLMEYQGLGFVDAIRDLAGRVGLEVPDEGAKRQDGPRHTTLVEVMASAARYYREQLKKSPRAIDYLKQRGLTGEVCARFGIGYAPEGWQNLEQVFDRYNSPELAAAGLVIDGENGRRYDRFRDRIMFPIYSQKGEVIAFGGRVLDKGEPKYLNSPETPLFEKGREVFGLPQARQALREHNRAIVVEGYMDVVALAQHGVGGALATLGTATTPTHVQKLLRQVDRIVFCFDGDAAGRKAAWRALENSLESLADDKQIGFVFLPPEHDPDSYVRDRGQQAFLNELAQAMPLSEFLLRELAIPLDLEQAEGRAQLVAEAKPLLKKLSAPLLRLQIVKRLGELAHMQQGEVERLCELRRHQYQPTPPARAPRKGPSLLRRVLGIFLQHPDLAPLLPPELLPEDDPLTLPLQRLLRTLADIGPSAGEQMTALVIERMRQNGNEADTRVLQEALEETLKQPLPREEAEPEIQGALEQLERDRLDGELDRLRRKAQAVGLDEEEKQEYARLIVDLQRSGRAGRRR